MKVPAKVDYGVRIAIDLASHLDEGPIKSREISQRENIPVKFLEQVIIPLRIAGLVKSVRGSRGGYLLAKPPSEIFLVDLVEILEGSLNLIDCLGDPGACQSSSLYLTRNVWKEVSEAIYKILRSVTLEDLVNRSKGGLVT